MCSPVVKYADARLGDALIVHLSGQITFPACGFQTTRNTSLIGGRSRPGPINKLAGGRISPPWNFFPSGCAESCRGIQVHHFMQGRLWITSRDFTLVGFGRGCLSGGLPNGAGGQGDAWRGPSGPRQGNATGTSPLGRVRHHRGSWRPRVSCLSSERPSSSKPSSCPPILSFDQAPFGRCLRSCISVAKWVPKAVNSNSHETQHLWPWAPNDASIR